VGGISSGSSSGSCESVAGFACLAGAAAFAVIELALPAEFSVECTVVAVSGQANEFERGLGALDEDGVGGEEWSADLTIDDEHDAGLGFFDAEPIGAAGGIDDGSDGESVGADGCDDEDLEFLAKNWPTSGEVVGGGADRGADDQSVAAEGGDFFVVDSQVDIEHFEGAT